MSTLLCDFPHYLPGEMSCRDKKLRANGGTFCTAEGEERSGAVARCINIQIEQVKSFNVLRRLGEWGGGGVE